MINMDKLAPIEIDPKTFLREHCTLPALPEIVNWIQEIISGDNPDIGKVSELISSDTALVAQILKIVNSSYYSLPKEVSEVRFAITFLGLYEIFRIVLSLSVIKTLAIDESNELKDFWFHSFLAAICTKYLAKKYSHHISFEVLWSAAILHDVGKLVYLKFFLDHYKALTTYCKEQGCLFSEAEKHFSLPTSSFLGTLLCDHWRLPLKIRDACEFHTLKDLQSTKGDTPSGDFIRMICLGNLMAVLCIEELSEDTKRKIANAIKNSLDLTETEFIATMGDIYDLRLEAQQFMEQF